MPEIRLTRWRQPPADLPATHDVTSFDDFTSHETEQYNLIESGQHWYGEKFSRFSVRAFSLTCEDPVPGIPAKILIKGAGRSQLLSSLEVTINKVKQDPLQFSGVSMDNETSMYADDRVRVYMVNLSSSSVEISMSYSAANTLSEAWLDHITVNWRRALKMSGDELFQGHATPWRR